MTEGQLRRENLFQPRNEPFSFVLIVFVYKYDTVRFSINESPFFSFSSEICNESKDQSLSSLSPLDAGLVEVFPQVYRVDNL